MDRAIPKELNCRCGWDGQEEHPCHGKAYTCRQPAIHRFYNPELVALAGAQLKVQMYDTYACDSCWEQFSKKLEH